MTRSSVLLWPQWADVLLPKLTRTSGSQHNYADPLFISKRLRNDSDAVLDAVTRTITSQRLILAEAVPGLSGSCGRKRTVTSYSVVSKHTHTHTRTHARTQARTHARTHARISLKSLCCIVQLEDFANKREVPTSVF